jgi:hypothetical protein
MQPRQYSRSYANPSSGPTSKPPSQCLLQTSTRHLLGLLRSLKPVHHPTS